MPIYQFEAMNHAGEEIKDEIEATSTEEAQVKIRELGYFPTKIRERSGKAKKSAAKRTRAGSTPGPQIPVEQHIGGSNTSSFFMNPVSSSLFVE